MTNTKIVNYILLALILTFYSACETDEQEQTDSPPQPTEEVFHFKCELSPLHKPDKIIDEAQKKEISGTLDINLSLLRGWIETGRLFLDGKTVDFQSLAIEEKSKYSSDFLEFHDAFVQAICFYEEKIQNPITPQEDKNRFKELRDEKLDSFFDTLLDRYSAKNEENKPCQEIEVLKYQCNIRTGDSTDDESLGTLDPGTEVCIKGKGDYLDLIELGDNLEFNEYWNIIEIIGENRTDSPIYVFGGCFDGRYPVTKYRKSIIESKFVKVSSSKGTFLRPEPSISNKTADRIRVPNSTVLENLREYKQNYDVVMVDNARHAGTGYWYKVRTENDKEGYIFQEHITECTAPVNWPFTEDSEDNHNENIQKERQTVRRIEFKESEIFRSRLIKQPDSLKYTRFEKNSTVLFRAKLKKNGKLRTKCLKCENDPNYALANDLIQDYVFDKIKKGKTVEGSIEIKFIVQK